VGEIRLFLAFVVAIDHLMLVRPLDISPLIKLGVRAEFAVMFFYMISGFLISLVLSRKYDASAGGTLRFYQSRLVRIFSLYWPLLLLGFFFDPSRRDWFLSHSLPDQLANIALIGADWRLAFASYPHLHPFLSIGQAWSLGAELTFYLMAPFLLRSWKATAALLVISAGFRAIFIHTVGWDHIWMYFFFPSTVLFFLLGHLARTSADRWSRLKQPAFGCASLGACILVLAVAPAAFDSLRFWLAALAFAAALPGVFACTANSRVSGVLANLSYPVYLLHLFAVAGVRDLAGLAPALFDAVSSYAILVAYLAVLTVAAWVAHRLIEQPVATAMHWAIRSAPAGRLLLAKVLNVVPRPPAAQRAACTVPGVGWYPAESRNPDRPILKKWISVGNSIGKSPSGPNAWRS
jgi:peptidoglycan/LPS O-acetylase OafA/YrhL